MDAVATRWMSLELAEEEEEETETSEGFCKSSRTGDVVIRSAGMSAVVKRGMCNQ